MGGQRGTFQVEGPAGAKALRQENAWNFTGTAESIEAREWQEKGKCTGEEVKEKVGGSLVGGKS